MTELIIIFIVAVLCMSIPIMWLAGKLTGVDLSLGDALIASAVSSVLGLAPGIIGWALSLVALYYILQKMTGALTFSDLIIMVVVGKLIAVLGVLAIASFVISHAPAA